MTMCVRGMKQYRLIMTVSVALATFCRTLKYFFCFFHCLFVFDFPFYRFLSFCFLQQTYVACFMISMDFA